MTKAVRAYLLKLYRLTRDKVVRNAATQYVLVAADDAAAVEATARMHAKAISRAAFAELLDDQGAQVICWTGGVAQGVQSPASAKSGGHSPIAPDTQRGGSKASHWAQTLSFMFRMMRVASISER